MYINFWYPVARAEEVLDDKPLRTELLGLPFVAFRDTEGTAHVLSDTCAHRGGSLSAGWVRDGKAICPYHGWEYDGGGKCTRIPSLDGKRPPARAKVDSYPVQEKYGIVFAFLGDLPEEERPSLFDVKEYDNDGWKSQLYVYDVECNYERSMENGLDPIHNEFVHPKQGTPTLSLEQQAKTVPVEDIDWGSKFYMPYPTKKNPDTELNPHKTGERIGAAGSGFTGPNQLVTWIDISAENAFHQYLFEAPISPGKTRIYFLNLRSWLLDDEHDMRIEKPTLEIIREDIDVLESLRPVATPLTNTKETLVPSDSVIVRYREWLSDWDANGWRIDYKGMREREVDTAFAIPSPGRREGGNWVLDTVPLMPGGEQVRRRRTSTAAAS